MLHRPEVLFLDEPFDGLDANTAAVAKELLKRLADQGRTILFCSHILEVVERVCSRIVVINEGRKIAEGTAADICDGRGRGHPGGGVQPADRRARRRPRRRRMLSALDRI